MLKHATFLHTMYLLRLCVWQIFLSVGLQKKYNLVLSLLSVFCLGFLSNLSSFSSSLASFFRSLVLKVPSVETNCSGRNILSYLQFLTANMGEGSVVPPSPSAPYPLFSWILLFLLLPQQKYGRGYCDTSFSFFSPSHPNNQCWRERISDIGERRRNGLLYFSSSPLFFSFSQEIWEGALWLGRNGHEGEALIFLYIYAELLIRPDMSIWRSEELCRICTDFPLKFSTYTSILKEEH
jgi:hypothetical protein